MRILLFALLLLFNSVDGHAQNLVPNNSFETMIKCPTNYGDFFAHSWFSTSSFMSPDHFSKCAHEKSRMNPSHIDTELQPNEGSSYAGLILLMASDDYSEYLSIRLRSPLIKDSVYHISMNVAYPKFSRFMSSYIGMHFTPNSIAKNNSNIIELEPEAEFKIDSVTTDGKWFYFETNYVATGNERYLTIGNFRSKKNNSFERIEGREKNEKGDSRFESSYLCIDDIIIEKLSSWNRDKNNEKPKNEIIANKLIDSVFIIHDILFKNNAYVLEKVPENLDSIIIILNNHADLSMEITGHTDNSGDEESNRMLSEKRAKSIAGYFIENGIDSIRITTSGLGESVPIASNDNDEGKAKNRRVEIKFRKK